MFDDYKKSILDFYKLKKENRLLSVNMEAKRRDKLRTECISVFATKNTKADQELIRSVFDPKNEYEDQTRSIERFDLDKFRPVVKFLNEETKDLRDDNLVKLLAWLIDFPPYQEWRELNEEEKNKIFDEMKKKGKTHKVIDKDESKDNGHKKPQGNTKPSFQKKYLALSGMVLLLTIAIFTAGQTDLIDQWTGKQDCMYWDGNQYVKVSCNKYIGDAQVVQLDTFRLANFKRITRPDTLTRADVGRVWRSKRNGKVNFFTSSGSDPIDTNRRVLPLTSYMLDKWGKVVQ